MRSSLFLKNYSMSDKYIFLSIIDKIAHISKQRSSGWMKDPSFGETPQFQLIICVGLISLYKSSKTFLWPVFIFIDNFKPRISKKLPNLSAIYCKDEKPDNIIHFSNLNQEINHSHTNPFASNMSPRRSPSVSKQ